MTDSDQPPQSEQSSQLSDFLQKSASKPGDSPAASGGQIGELQSKQDELENKLHEERFMWVLAAVIVLDIAFLLEAKNWAAPLVIGILQLFGLVIFASRCRVDPIMPLLDRFAGMLPFRGNKQ